MSFQRIGPNNKKKQRMRKNPAWDDSVHDLTVHRATPEEIMMRKESHKSKNHISVKLEKMRKDQKKKNLTDAQTQQLAIMKEILYDQQQLENVLAKSDRMMNVVKDLFGDDPKRFVGFPNVTSAPHAQVESNGSYLVAVPPNVYTRTEKLSDSVMNQSALNDIQSSDSDEDGTDYPEPISFESKLNVERFQQFVQEEEEKWNPQEPVSLVAQLNQNQSKSTSAVTKSPVPLHATTQSIQALRSQSGNTEGLAAVLNDQGFGDLVKEEGAMRLLLAALAVQQAKTPPRPAGAQVFSTGSSSPSAINDTNKVHKTKKVMSASSVPKGTNVESSGSDLRKVLLQLERQLSEYEHQTGRQSLESTHKCVETFSGYTVSLISVVAKLTRYLKETDLGLRTEATLRDQLTQDVYQLRTIIDALATDLIVTQEEYGKLYCEHQRYRDQTEGQLKTLMDQMKELRMKVFSEKASSSESKTSGLQQQQEQNFHLQQQQPQESLYSAQQQQQLRDSVEINKKSDECIQASSPLTSHHDTSTISSDLYHPLPRHLQSNSQMASAAIILSPPIRKTRVFTEQPDPGQDLPLAATVNVPRPTPLVQTNITEPLTGLMDYGLARKKDEIPVIENGIVATQPIVDMDRKVEEALNTPAMQSLMQDQIRELNLQQEEARRRLRDLLDNQKIQQLQLQQNIRDEEEEVNPVRKLQFEEEVEVHHETKGVSPPISPISPDSVYPPGKNPDCFQQGASHQGITVSLPLALLDDSTEQ